MTKLTTTIRIEMEVPKGTDRYDAQAYAQKFREWLESSKKWKVKVKEIGYLDVRE